MLARFSLNDNYPTLRIEKRCGARDTTYNGAFACGENIILAARLPRTLGVTEVALCIRRDTLAPGEEQLDGTAHEYLFGYERTELDEDEYSLSLDTAALCKGSESGLFYYTYIFRRGKDTLVASSVDNVNFTLVHDGWREFRLLIYRADMSVPDWPGGGIMYHIFVDRFARGEGKVSYREDTRLDPNWDGGIPQYAEYRGAPVKNNVFFGGNLWGVREKLPYLRSLGVSVIYLSPIFSASSNHKYDTSDYFEVDAGFGGREALDALIAEAHACGIKIILDGVFNHTGSDSRYFDEYGRYGLPASDPLSPYHEWYDFRDPQKEGDVPYVCWWGIRILPRLNTHIDSCREFFTGRGGVVEHYTSLGVDGWRLDVADELPDRFLKELRKRVRSVNPDSVLIGEVWENAADKIAYGKRRSYFRGEQLDSVMNYPTRRALLDYAEYADAKFLAGALTELYSSYPPSVSASLMNVIGTHDTERVLTLLGDPESVRENAYAPNAQQARLRLSDEARERGIRKLCAISALQYTLFGFPCVYYGDETGMEGMGDPFCRYPMRWKDPEWCLLEHYRTLGRLRCDEEIFRGGEFRVSRAEDGYFEFVRYKDGCDGYIKVAVNMGKILHECRVSGGVDLYTGKRIVGNVTLGEGEFLIAKKKGVWKSGVH